MAYVKVYKYKQQVSYDQGETWEDTGEYVPSGDPIGYYDTLEECMAFGGKFKLTLNDSSIVSSECDSSSSVTSGEVATQYSGTVESAEIGNCAVSIDDFAFYNCRSLTSVTIGNSVTSIGLYAFNRCSGLTTVGIPSGVTSIDMFAFGDCSGLTAIDISNSVTSIGGGAFYNCRSLTSVTIPNSVANIGSGAFRGCSSLTSVTVIATIPPSLEVNAFYDTGDCPIYVPADSVEVYKAASGWSTYASRIQAIP